MQTQYINEMLDLPEYSITMRICNRDNLTVGIALQDFIYDQTHTKSETMTPKRITTSPRISQLTLIRVYLPSFTAWNQFLIRNAFPCTIFDMNGWQTHYKVLVPEEKQWRVMSYILQLREGLFSLAAACVLESPCELRREHVVFTNESGQSIRVVDLFPYPESV